ncbi:MAG TPA: magnesium/cobalt transporter CorA [Thermoanaerobaculia bacterium]|jgi:magnesium transporter|nr:magnesium/cobalt transporter CorA [Thermoanaerobaculia bacterium]
MTTIRVSLCRDGVLRQGDVSVIDDWNRDSDDKLWVDIQEPEQEVIEPLLEERFGFHELAAEDTLSPNTLPKYDSFTAYDFFIFRTVDVNLSAHQSETYKIAAFLGKNFLFTVHRRPLTTVDDVCNRLGGGDRRLLERGPDFLLYSIVDAMVDAHFPLIEQIEEAVDDLQDRIFENAEDAHLGELLHLKRDINVLRRHSLPQRELLNQISRGDARFIQREHLIYFRDVYDHMHRISETIDVDRDQMTGTMDAYLSVVANRTNEIMKVLTIFSAVMLPLTLIAGIYGMNFEHMPELHWLHGYPFALGLMLGVTLLMLFLFSRRGWIHVPTPRKRRRQRV